jgi:DnaJ-class molecular chaperone
MRCLTCNGRGRIDNTAENHAQLPIIPCPRCQGTGLDHCCDGADASCEIDERAIPPTGNPHPGAETVSPSLM